MKIIKTTILYLSMGLISNYSLAMETHDYSKMIAQDSKKTRLDENTKKNLLEALTINESLHKYFYNYDESMVEKNAQSLRAALQKISNPEIAKMLVFSIEKLSQIKASNERVANNKIYHTVSSTLVHLIDTYDIGGNYKGFYCPMVKMKWVQNTSTLAKAHNPYTPKMQQCGEMLN